jgi:hypothetical protein
MSREFKVLKPTTKGGRRLALALTRCCLLPRLGYSSTKGNNMTDTSTVLHMIHMIHMYDK